MLDITFIRENLAAVEANIQNRHMKADPRAALALADDRSQAIQKLESLRASRNENAAKMKGKLEPEVRQALIEEGKQIKEGKTPHLRGKTLRRVRRLHELTTR